jgi:hypothetical protein
MLRLQSKPRKLGKDAAMAKAAHELKATSRVR